MTLLLSRAALSNHLCCALPAGLFQTPVAVLARRRRCPIGCGHSARFHWSSTKSPFEVLGVKSTATLDEIKKAYFDCAKRCHPDACDDEHAHQRFQEVSDAYSLLMDEEQRSSYEAGLGIRNAASGSKDAKGVFDRVVQDLRFKNPTVAMEERALYAVIAQKNGNDSPTRDFVVDYRAIPRNCLPMNYQIEAVPESEVAAGSTKAAYQGSDGAHNARSR